MKVSTPYTCSHLIANRPYEVVRRTNAGHYIVIGEQGKLVQINCRVGSIV